MNKRKFKKLKSLVSILLLFSVSLFWFQSTHERVQQKISSKENPLFQITICQPKVGVSSRLSAFTGYWRGKWKLIPVALAITSVTPEGARIFFVTKNSTSRHKTDTISNFYSKFNSRIILEIRPI